MTFATFGQLDEPTPTLPEVQGMIADNARLLMPTVAATIDPIGPALQENAATLGKVTGRIGRVINGALKTQREVLGIPIDALNASLASQLAEQQATVNQLQAMSSMSPAVQGSEPRGAMPLSLGGQWLSFFRCSDGQSGAAEATDSDSINSLLGSGYVLSSQTTFPDIYSATGWYQTQAGRDWINTNCGSVYIPPPIGPPPPPEGPPPPPDPTAPYPHGIAYHCEGYQDVTPVPIGADLTKMGDGKFLWMPNTPVFPSLDDGMKWVRENGAKVLLDNCPLVPTSPPPPPPGCCPVPDLTPYIDKLCKCIKQASTVDPVDTDQPLAYFLGEGKLKWHKDVSEFLGFDGAEIFEAGSLDEMKAIWNKIVNG